MLTVFKSPWSLFRDSYKEREVKITTEIERIFVFLCRQRKKVESKSGLNTDQSNALYLQCSLQSVHSVVTWFCCFSYLDAFVGGIIGLIFAYICYRQHYPPLGNTACHKSYVSLLDQNSMKKEERPTADNATGLPLEGITEGPVWLRNAKWTFSLLTFSPSWSLNTVFLTVHFICTTTFVSFLVYKDKLNILFLMP